MILHMFNVYDLKLDFIDRKTKKKIPLNSCNMIKNTCCLSIFVICFCLLYYFCVSLLYVFVDGFFSLDSMKCFIVQLICIEFKRLHSFDGMHDTSSKRIQDQ